MLKLGRGIRVQKTVFTSGTKAEQSSFVKGLKWVGTGISVAALTVGGVLEASNPNSSLHHLTAGHLTLPWDHKQGFRTKSFDHASLRRGYQVYKQVCAACHSMTYMRYRELTNVTHTPEEVKAEAAETMVLDGPDAEGKMFERPGKPSDQFPSPYPNMEAAKAANNGANPPDLSMIVWASPGNEDYIFWLLTSYCDPPEGIKLGEGQHYNPYFKSGALSMAQQLFDEAIEYEDGTPATMSQLAKDVVNFLAFTAEPFRENLQMAGMKAMLITTGLLIPSFLWFRWYQAPHKFAKMVYKWGGNPKAPKRRIR